MEPLRSVTDADVRVSSSGRIVAAPLWAYEPLPYTPGRYRPIAAMWEIWWEGPPRPDQEAQARDLREACIRTIADHASPTVDRQVARIRLVALKTFPYDPNRRASASLSYPTAAAIKTCRTCGVEFFGLGSTVICTPACEAARRDATRTRGTPAPRKVVREMKACRWCREGFTPRRRDAAFCSTTCRVAHHRLHRD